MYRGPADSRVRNISIFLCGLLLYSACTLPEPDGVEAKLAARTAGLPVLSASNSRDPGNIARKGLLLDPTVRAAASDVKASADEVRIQRAALFPSLDFSFNAGVGHVGVEHEAVLSGEQLITDFGNTDREISVADIDLQINYLTFQKSVDDALVEVLTAYDAVLKYVLLLDVRRKQLSAMQDLAEKVADRMNAGAASTTDMLETRKRLQAAQFLVHDTELALAEARDKMTRLTGQSRGGKVPQLRSNCSRPVISDAVRIAELQLAKAYMELKLAEKARNPRVVISPAVRGRFGHGINAGVNVGVNSDLLEGGALTARVNAARNIRDSAVANQDAAKREDALDDRGLQRQIASAARKSEMLDRQIELLAETQNLYQSQYFDLGTRDISDLLDNEEEYYDRQAEKIELNSELATNRVECAARDRSLRNATGLSGSSLYGYPLAPDAI